MREYAPPDEALLARLPLPLAQLYRRAHNAKTPLECHLAAFYLWEASLKLLAAATVAAYACRPDPDPHIAERLRNLARPSLGHWWEFVRLLVPALAERGDDGFLRVRDLLLGRSRDDLPRAAGLDAALREVLDGRAGARATVRLTELFDRLVRYRNQELGHGAAGLRPGDFYGRVGRALLAGVTEVLDRLDVLAGRRLLYVAEVRLVGDRWLVERYELTGENARRVESLEFARDEADRLPGGERIYLEGPGDRGGDGTGERPSLLGVHPLVVYDAEAEEALFLSARRGGRRAEYLGYSSGRTADRADLSGDHRDLLSRLLGLPVAEKEAEVWAALSQAEDPPERPSAAPTRRALGEFELLSELGRGGMGVVYRAWQPSLGRQVAVKKLFQSGDPKAEARFGREVRALGKVEHPHLVKIYTSGSAGEDWFFAMELLEGATLEGVCAQLQSRSARPESVDAPTWTSAVSTACEEARRSEVPLSDAANDPAGAKAGAHAEPAAAPQVRTGPGYVRRVVELVRQVAEAAHALHEAGILHRDIKPGNVMVDGAGERAVLMDLGLAQVADEVDGRLTRTRQIVGTLRYASPEQVAGVGGLDRRSDVYALGATLWELLTLRPMFGATARTPAAELIRRIPVEDPARPRKHHPGLPRDLEAVVLKCLEKEPHQRYATAAALAEDLRRFSAGEPVEAVRTGPLTRAAKWARRRPVIAGLLAAVALVTVAGMGGITWAYRQALREAARSREEAARADGEARAARAAEVRADAEASRADGEAKVARAALSKALYPGQIGRAQVELAANDPAGAARVLEETAPGLRGWEYRYLHRCCDGSPLILRGQGGPVHSVAFGPDGARLATASEEGTARVWDARTGAGLLTLGHGGRVRSVAFSPDGARLATASENGTARVWDARTGAGLLTLRGVEFDGSYRRIGGLGDFERVEAVTAVAFSPDGARLVTGVGGVEWRGPGRATMMDQVWGPGGPQSVAAPRASIARVWDVHKGIELLTLRGHPVRVSSVAFSPDGIRLATASEDGTARVWDARTGAELLTLRGHKGPVLSVAFGPDGARLATASEDGTARVWDDRTGAELFTLGGPVTGISSVSFSPDGFRLATGSSDGTAQVWDARTGSGLLTLRGHAGRVLSVSFSPDGFRLATASEDGTARVWDARTGAELLTLRVPQVPRRVSAAPGWSVNAVAFSPDDALLAGGLASGKALVWDARTGGPVAFLPHGSAVNAVTFGPDGARLATASDDHSARVWDARTGAELLSLRGHATGVNSVAFSPDGLRLATASADRTARVWDARTGASLLTLRGHTAPVLSVAFGPDGSRLATASEDGTARVWDARTGASLLTLRGGERPWERTWGGGLRNAGAPRQVAGPLDSIAFSPDGERLATVSRDGAVRVRDARTGLELLTLRGQGGRSSGLGLGSVAFSPDGSRLATGSQDGTARLWDARREAGSDSATVWLVPPLRVLGAWNPWIEEEARRHALAISWHAEDAESAGRRGDTFATAFHLARLDALPLAGPGDRWHRGFCRLRLGHRAAGLTDLAHADLCKDRNPDRLAWHALACLVTGNRAGYRAACVRLLEVVGPDPGPHEAAAVARVCCLSPAGGADPNDTARLAEKAVVALPNDLAALSTLGAALLRAGRPADAVIPLEKAYSGRKAQWQFGPWGMVNDELLLALTHQRLGQAEPARRWLSTAATWMDRYRVPSRACGTIGAGPTGAIPAVAALLAVRPDPRPIAGDEGDPRFGVVVSSTPSSPTDPWPWSAGALDWSDERMRWWLEMDLLRAEVEAALAAHGPKP